MATKKKSAGAAPAKTKPAKQKTPTRIVVPAGMTADEARQILSTDKDLRTYVKEGTAGMIEVPKNLDADAVKTLLHHLSSSTPGEKINLAFGNTPEHITMDIVTDKPKKVENGEEKPGTIPGYMTQIGGLAANAVIMQDNIMALLDRLDGGSDKVMSARDSAGSENSGDPSTWPLNRQLELLQVILQRGYNNLTVIERRLIALVK